MSWKWFLFWFFVLVVFTTVIVSAPRPAHADHNRWLPALPTKVQLRVLERGYGIYCLDSNASGYPNFRAQMETVYADEADRVGIRWFESNNGHDCDIWHLMAPSFPCGAGASGCTYYTGDPVNVYYNRAMLYFDWKTTIGHEHGHWDGSHERYHDSNGGILCDPSAKYTRNSCGTGVWWVTDYDRDVAWNVLVPDRPLELWMDNSEDWADVHWGNHRTDCYGLNLNYVGTNPLPGAHPAHMTCRNDVATRVAFGHSNGPGEPIQWVGEVCGDALDYCNSPYDDFERGFDRFWKGCLYVHAENTALYWVPQASGYVAGDGYWSEAGCW